MKKILVLSALFTLFLTLAALQVNAAVITSGVWKYERNDTGVTVVGTTQTFTNSGSCLNIPAKIDGYNVTEIKSGAFSNGGFYGISIPNSVKTIGNGAFSGCSRISSVSIPNNVTSLGYSVFINCNNLSSVTIYGNPNLSPSALGTNKKTVRTYHASSKVISFCNANSSYLTLAYLDTVQVDTTPDVFTYTDSYGMWTFNRSTATITKYAGQSSSVTVPKKVNYQGTTYDVKWFGEKAISGNNNITSLTIGVPNIGKSAVYNCPNLRNITLEPTVMFLDTYCFWYCQNVTNLRVNGNPITSYHNFYPNPSLYVICNHLSLHVRWYCYNNNIRDSFNDINLSQNYFEMSAFQQTIQNNVYGGLSDPIYFVIAAAVGTVRGSHGNLALPISSNDKYYAKQFHGYYKSWIKEKYPTTYTQYIAPDWFYFNIQGIQDKWW